MTWFWFAIAAQTLWGICDVMDKVIRERYLRDSVVLAVWLGMAALPTAVVIGLVRGMDAGGAEGVLLVAGLLSPLAFLFYFRALAVEEASRVVPLFQLSPLWALLLGTVFLGEVLTGTAYLAFGLIFGAGVLVSLQAGAKGLRLSQAFWLMLACTFFYGSALVLTRYAFGIAPIDGWDAAKWLTLGYFLGGISFLLAPGVRHRAAAAVRALRPAGVALLVTDNLVLSSVARVLNVFALSLGPVALVSVLNVVQSVFVLFVALVGAWLFPSLLHEEVTVGKVGVKFAALGLLLAGLVVLNLAGGADPAELLRS